MEKRTAICGLDCSVCPAYEATRDNSNEKRKATAEQWTKSYGSEIKPENINCLGCTNTTGTLFEYCTMCEIRKCGMTKGVANCAQCAEYACAKLTKFLAMAPQAKLNLEEIRAKR